VHLINSVTHTLTHTHTHNHASAHARTHTHGRTPLDDDRLIFSICEMELYKRQQSKSDTILTSRIFPNLSFQQSTVYGLHVLNVNQIEEHKLSGLFTHCKLTSNTYLLHPEASRIIYRPTSKHPSCILSTLNVCINRCRKVRFPIANSD
jgi:hypothetical protein